MPDQPPTATVILAKSVLASCQRLGVMLATAESCTGGLISAALTTVPGSSRVVERGFVTYTNEAKQEMLGVPGAGVLALSRALNWVGAVLPGGVEHGADVFGRDVGLDYVDLVEHETASGCEDADAVAHVRGNLLSRAEAQHVLRVAPAAPEHDPPTVAALQLRRVHSRRGTLYRVDRVESRVHHVRDDRFDGPAAVNE